MGELTAEWCEEVARGYESDAREDAATGFHGDAEAHQRTAEVYRIAAAALRYAEAERESRGHQWQTNGTRRTREAHIALLDACGEATDGRA